MLPRMLSHLRREHSRHTGSCVISSKFKDQRHPCGPKAEHGLVSEESASKVTGPVQGAHLARSLGTILSDELRP